MGIFKKTPQQTVAQSLEEVRKDLEKARLAIEAATKGDPLASQLSIIFAVVSHPRNLIRGDRSPDHAPIISCANLHLQLVNFLKGNLGTKRLKDMLIPYTKSKIDNRFVNDLKLLIEKLDEFERLLNTKKTNLTKSDVMDSYERIYAFFESQLLAAEKDLLSLLINESNQIVMLQHLNAQQIGLK